MTAQQFADSIFIQRDSGSEFKIHNISASENKVTLKQINGNVTITKQFSIFIFDLTFTSSAWRIKI